MNVENWTISHYEGEALDFSKLPLCKIETSATVINSDSLAEMITYCAENSIHVNDILINEMIDMAERTGDEIADNVAPAFQDYLTSGVSLPSAETLQRVNDFLGD